MCTYCELKKDKIWCTHATLVKSNIKIQVQATSLNILKFSPHRHGRQEPPARPSAGAAQPTVRHAARAHGTPRSDHQHRSASSAPLLPRHQNPVGSRDDEEAKSVRRINPIQQSPPSKSHHPFPPLPPLAISPRPAMEMFYYLVFGALAAIVAALELGKSGKDRVATSPAFNSFKNNYILVYSLMMCTPPS